PAAAPQPTQIPLEAATAADLVPTSAPQTPTPVVTAAPTQVATAAPLSAAALLTAPTAQIAAPARPTTPVRPAEAVPAASADMATLQRQLNELEARVAALTAENQRQMERLALMTNGAIADMEQLFNALKLELRSVPGEAPPVMRRRSSAPAATTRPPAGQGGPFLPWPPQGRASRTPSDAVEPLLPDLQTLFMLHQIVRSLPLTPPLQEAVVTGPFGYRRDPFNRRSAFHDGIDLQAPMRSPVHATASGTVVVAGMRPAYGRVVEVDHGFGIRTRYAHLASLAVKEGDRIERNTLVGALGSSGRSASPHLHYEVLFNGRPHDPADLLVLAEGIRTLR
ncbi:MAG: peptidoglycan DD-metalloendopeptidase family protein, partial [Alphaproteobacteria bacterium]|nr:peptidoglycan DD-metalloendopeptidase family protein [Alphaproteobacteria bacterium]